MKEFCPSSCRNFETKDDRVCKPTGEDAVDCWHVADKAYKQPVPIELMWYAGVWIDAFIVGKNGEDFVVQSPKAEGVSYIKKTSPLIRRVN